MPRADWKQPERNCNSQDRSELDEKVRCGRILCQVRETLQSREEPIPETDREEDTGILTSLLGLVLFSSPLVPLLKKGQQMAAVSA